MGKRGLTYSAFIKQVKDTVQYYGMLNNGDKVLAAVSGGADSVCMLMTLLAIRRGLDIDIVVAHLDHGLRGKESAKDSVFVQGLAAKLGIECARDKIDVKTAGRKKASLEEKAREARYKFLYDAAKKHGCNVIAMGHTMDDQAETVLMRVILGSSLSGMAGIPPQRQEEDLRLVRPLIRTLRKDILTFLKKENIKYVEDSTNRDLRFVRNRVRNVVLPFLEKENPKIKRALVNLADTLREDVEFLSESKKELSAVFAEKMKESAGISVKDIVLQPRTLRKELLKELFRAAGGDIKKLSYRHWMDMDRFLRSGGEKSLDLPGNVRIVRDDNKIFFSGGEHRS